MEKTKSTCDSIRQLKARELVDKIVADARKLPLDKRISVIRKGIDNAVEELRKIK